MNNRFFENPACRRFIIGVLALAQIPYKVVASRFDVSKSQYYSLQSYAERLLEGLFGIGETPRKVLLVTDSFIARCVMCLSLYCRAPTEGIVQFFDLVIGYHVSKGNIYRIRKRAAEKASAFDESIHLDDIREIATDEIFQQGKPVLTGIDLDSNYVFMIKAEEDRSGETWAKCLEEQKLKGLAPELNVSDSGSGLQRGIEQAFPGIGHQPDAFHMLRALGQEVRRVERYVLSALREYCKAEYSIFYRKRGNPTKEDGKTYWRWHGAIDDILQQADEVLILYEWIREAAGFTGCCYAKSLAICEWILDEMAKRFPERQKYQQAIRAFRRELQELLSFLLRIQNKMLEKAKDFPLVNEHDFMLLYQQRFCTSSKKWELMENRLWKRFGRRLPEAKEVLDILLRTTHRASSMIENLNGRLRCFIDLKREIPESFMILIKVFFNTKKQIRSRHGNWKGTSALDRLTGKQNPEFLDIVTAPMNYIF